MAFGRDEIVQGFRRRIDEGRRTKLSVEERLALAEIWRERLIEMAQMGTDTYDTIQALCLAEIRLLEEGYPSNTLKASYLPEYTKLLKQAITSGALPLTKQNSYEKEGELRHYAFDFLVYDIQTQRAVKSSVAASEIPVTPPTVSVDLDRYIEALQELMASQDAIDLIAGIAAATGRQYIDVVSLAQFGVTEAGDFNRVCLQEHPYLLKFQPATTQVVQDIVTLLPAVDILAAINKLRGQEAIVALERNGQGAEAQAVVAALVERIKRRIHQLLNETGIASSLATKIVAIDVLRELYGIVSIHFFCLPSQEGQFLKHYCEPVAGRALNSSFTLSRNGSPLAEQGVKTPSSGLLPQMRPGREWNSTEETFPMSREEVSAHKGADSYGEVLEKLQMLAKEQSQTIKILSEVIVHLREDLAAVLRR